VPSSWHRGWMLVPQKVLSRRKVNARQDTMTYLVRVRELLKWMVRVESKKC